MCFTFPPHNHWGSELQGAGSVNTELRSGGQEVTVGSCNKDLYIAAIIRQLKLFVSQL